MPVTGEGGRLPGSSADPHHTRKPEAPANAGPEPDDYLGKPFAFEELLARVRANLRPRAALPPTVLQAGGLRIDPLRHEVTAAGRTVSLSAREFALLKAFVDHPGQVLTRQELLSMAWDMNFDPHTNLVDVYVGYLRRKLGEPIIETVRGEGTASRWSARHLHPQ